MLDLLQLFVNIIPMKINTSGHVFEITLSKMCLCIKKRSVSDE